MLNTARNALASRYFNSDQIDKILPNLDEELLRRPECLSEIVDTWNTIMSASGNPYMPRDKDMTPALAKPPANSIMRHMDMDMTYILADVEPNLLRLDPDKLLKRHMRVMGLGIARNSGENWALLLNAPRGFYLQDWVQLSKKIYYIEENVLNFLYDKKQLKEMTVHPLLKAAKCVECEFDIIRLRYLFALRTGYKSLGHMFKVQTALTAPGLRELLLSDTKSYLRKFAPFCSYDEYNSFSDLIKNYELDEDDADVLSDLAELNALSHQERRAEYRKRFENNSHEELD